MKNKLYSLLLYFFATFFLLLGINCLYVYLFRGEWNFSRLYLIVMGLVFGLGSLEGFENAKIAWNTKDKKTTD